MNQPASLVVIALGGLLGAPAAAASELHDAILVGKTDAVEALLAAGVDVNEAGDSGTPLHMATAAGNEAIARLLIEKHADMEASLATGARPLHTAASYGHENVARLLIARGAVIDSRDAFDRTPCTLPRDRGRSALQNFC